MVPLHRLVPALGACLLTAQAQATPCALDQVPAATLLVPHFSVDVSSCADFDPNLSAITDTEFTVVNPTQSPVLTKVTVWTNAAVPVLDFEVYLEGYGEETLSMGRVLCNGYLPQTGSAVLNQGAFSEPLISFPGCNSTTDPSNGSPVFSGDGSLDATTLDELRAALTGADVGGGQCAGVATASGLAEGYVTIDAIEECSSLTPADSMYHSVIIGYDNSLIGSVRYVDPVNNFATGMAAIAIEAAAAGVYEPGDVTFYGRYNASAASDRREPLPTTYAPRFAVGGVYETTDLIVWREANQASTTFACGSEPAWSPLQHANTSGFDSAGVFAIDDAGVASSVETRSALPYATQRVGVLDVFSTNLIFGSLWLNLQHEKTVYEGSPPNRFGQAWVGHTFQATGRFAETVQAPPMDSACTNEDFNATSPGPFGPIGP